MLLCHCESHQTPDLHLRLPWEAGHPVRPIWGDFPLGRVSTWLLDFGSRHRNDPILMHPELKTAVETIYSAFGDIPKPEFIDGCSCCIDQKDLDILITKPLRLLTPDELDTYTSCVFLTVGSEADFLYLLPRIFEIFATDSWWNSPEVLAAALKYAGFEQWQNHHKESVTKYLRAVLTDLIEQEQSGLAIDSWICCLGRLLSDVTPYLEALIKNPSRIIEYYEVNSTSLIQGKLDNSFWDDASQKTHDQVIAWFNSSEIRKIINESYGI